MEIEIGKLRKVFEDCNQNAQNCTYSKGEKSKTPVKVVKNKRLTATEYLQIMEENFGSCENPNTPFTKIGDWLLTGELDYPDCSYKDDILANIEPV